MTKYYYVKYNGRWTVAGLNVFVTSSDIIKEWKLIGDRRPFMRLDFDEIGDEIPMPREDE